MPPRFRTILLEDDHQMRAMLTLFLEVRGHEVLAFDSPAACPAFLDDECPCPTEHPCGDLLISDLNMPVMSGLEFIRRQSARGCKGKIRNKLLLTANISKESELQAQELGCAVMHKPFKLANLLAWVAAAEARIEPNRQLAPLAPN